MPNKALDALKSYVYGKKEPKDIELPLPEGKRPDPRLPKQPKSSLLRGLEAAREATQRKKR